MLKQLRFDLYKMLKSPIMWAICVLSFAFLLKDPIKYFIVEKNTLSGGLVMLDIRHYFVLCVIFFTVFLVGKDYSSGYYKNIGTVINKAYYILSKVICIFAFTVIWLGLYLLLMLIFCEVFAGGHFEDVLVYNPERDEWGRWGSTGIWFSGSGVKMNELYAPLFILWFSSFAYGLMVMALLFVTKNNIAALIIPLILLFTGQFIEVAIDNCILDIMREHKIPTINISTISDYFSVFPETIIREEHFFNDKVIRISACMLTGYSVFAVGVSFLFCYLRKRKN